MRKHGRFLYQPVLPLGKNGTLATGCKAHRAIATQAAAEGTVLLKNDGTLPLKTGAKVCLFGLGAGDFLYGGGGSGSVITSNLVTLAQGLQAAADRGDISSFPELSAFYQDEVRKLNEEARRTKTRAEYLYWIRARKRELPIVPEDLYQQAKAFGDTAIFCVSRYSSEGTDCGDRSGGEGDFYLWSEEQALLDRLCKDFSKVVVVLNVCGPVSTAEYRDNDRIGAVLYPMFSGSCAGEVLTDILLGKRYPSGHLQDTLARSVDDYPSAKYFGEFSDHTDYVEDIFVGYRYFETFAPQAVVYPFGFGLGYTTFSVSKKAAAINGTRVSLEVCVENIGSAPGKEVVQAYLTAPQGKLGKAKKVLCAFAKTKELLPGEKAVVTLSFELRDFGSFDDLGKLVKSAFILEKGEYSVHVGSNVRDTKTYLSFRLEEDIICKRCHSYMAPKQLAHRLTADGTLEPLPQAQHMAHKPIGYRLKAQAPEQPISLVSALEDGRLDEFIAGMSDGDIAEMLYGHPMMNAADTNGMGLPPKQKRDVAKIPNVPTADGPAGLRAYFDSDVSATFFPCANVVAQTWNLPLARRVAAAGALEVKENNIGIWLTPALNIHRSPLCGRNFEYYSEDPLCAGLFASSVVKGIQSRNIAATIKHFCANNREINRKGCDSRVSERALREIYLRGFEICVKRAKPWALMTAYNPVNGEQSSTNWEAINGILRGEWKYDGVVMTDWWANSDLKDELYAGSDVKMPEMITYMWADADAGFDPVAQLATGELDRSVCLASVRRVLTLMGKLD